MRAPIWVRGSGAYGAPCPVATSSGAGGPGSTTGRRFSQVAARVQVSAIGCLQVKDPSPAPVARLGTTRTT